MKKLGYVSGIGMGQPDKTFAVPLFDVVPLLEKKRHGRAAGQQPRGLDRVKSPRARARCSVGNVQPLAKGHQGTCAEETLRVR